MHVRDPTALWGLIAFCRGSDTLSADGILVAWQGVTLVLSAFCTLQHQPSKGVLEALAAAMRPSLNTFKRQQLASCLDAFKALGFHPGNDLIQVIATYFATFWMVGHLQCVDLCPPPMLLQRPARKVGCLAGGFPLE